MGVIWWVTEYLMPSPTFWNGFCISIFIFVLWSFLLDSTHIQIILSMYSIHRMRGNRNQTVNTVKREIFAAIKFCGFDHKAVLVRFNFVGFPLLYVEHIWNKIFVDDLIWRWEICQVRVNFSIYF